MSFLWMAVIGCFLLAVASALDVKSHSLAGTQFEHFRMTDKQLAILRYFAEQTFRSEANTTSRWAGWWDNPFQDDNDALRYQISGIAYAAYVAALNTPAYVELSVRILRDCVERLIDVRVWRYISMFDDFVQQPTFPSPVAYKNIMYSGHLAQVIALYEDLSGDTVYSTKGWNFTWWNHSAYPAPVWCSTPTLMSLIEQQMTAYRFGGVPCEPDSIFIICNNFPHNAFHVYDRVHKTNYSLRMDQGWQQAVMMHGITRPSLLGTGQYFNLVYLMFPGLWDTLASEGSDAWALSWMGTWWNHTADPGVLAGAYAHMANSSRWATSSCLLDTSDVHEGNQDGGDDGSSVCCRLTPNELGNLIFPFPSDITTSLIPMIEAQYRTYSESSSRSLKTDTATGIQGEGKIFTGGRDDHQVPPARRNCSIALFESFYSMSIDYDADGTVDGYRYNSSTAYADWATANLLLSYVLPTADSPRTSSEGTLFSSQPSPSTSLDYLRHVFNISAVPTFRQRMAAPYVSRVEYPQLQVAVAFANRSSTDSSIAKGSSSSSSSSAGQQHRVMLLVIETLRGDGEWTTNLGFTVMEVMGFAAAPVSVSLNGAAFGNFTWNSSTAVLDINVPHPVHGERQRWNIIGTTTSTKT